MVELFSVKKSTHRAIEAISTPQQHRTYLGMSMLGHSCERFLWYTFRWCYIDEHSARMTRLLNRGHREEEALIDLLKQVGVNVYGEQTEIVDVHGHVKGHLDGIGKGLHEAPKTEHVLEFKTMNDSAFKAVKKDGVKVSKPLYYAQCQLYMNGTGLTRTMFMAVNKNDDSLYMERIKSDGHTADTLLRRADNIVLSERPPIRKYKKSWYECKWCSARELCHFDGAPTKSCRICTNCDLETKGRWSCSFLADEILGEQMQREMCREFNQMDLD